MEADEVVGVGMTGLIPIFSLSIFAGVNVAALPHEGVLANVSYRDLHDSAGQAGRQGK